VEQVIVRCASRNASRKSAPKLPSRVFGKLAKLSATVQPATGWKSTGAARRSQAVRKQRAAEGKRCARAAAIWTGRGLIQRSVYPVEGMAGKEQGDMGCSTTLPSLR